MNKYYTILELSPGATKDEIRKAYRRLSKKYHPDMNQGSKESEEKFKLILAAYEALKDFAERPDTTYTTHNYSSATTDRGGQQHSYYTYTSRA